MIKNLFEVAGVITIIVATGALFVVIATIPPTQCAVQADAMGKPHMFNYLYGCMIEAKPGKWVQLRSYRIVE